MVSARELAGQALRHGQAAGLRERLQNQFPGAHVVLVAQAGEFGNPQLPLRIDHDERQRIRSRSLPCRHSCHPPRANLALAASRHGRLRRRAPVPGEGTLAFSPHYPPTRASPDRAPAETTIYEMEQRDEFPRRFRLTAPCVVWDLEEVEACIEARKEASRSAKAGTSTGPDVRPRQYRPVRRPLRVHGPRLTCDLECQPLCRESMVPRFRRIWGSRARTSSMR